MTSERKYSPNLELGVRVRTIVYLRWIAVFGQILTCSVVGGILNFNLPWFEVYLTIFALAASNILLYPRYPWHHRLSETATTIVICADIFQLALLVYFTGGLSNPFVMLFIVPIAISISNLPLRSTSILIVFTLALISVLGFFHYPLIQEDMTYLVNPPILTIGIWISLLVTILFLSAYMGSLTRESREVAGALNVTEELLSNEQNLSSLDGLAAAAAHQLGTPLGTINLIASELMKNEKISKEGKEDLEVLLQEINKCKNILSSLGEESSLDDDIVNKIELHALLEELSELIKVKGINPKIVFSRENDNLRFHLIERRSELLLGLSNIIENAAEFAKNLVLLSVDEKEGQIHLKIEDDGDGFPNDIMNRLGDPYVSSRSSDSSKEKGLGLGFFISKTLFERLGIRVEIYNKAKPENGAVVSLLIPKKEWSEKHKNIS